MEHKVHRSSSSTQEAGFVEEYNRKANVYFHSFGKAAFPTFRSSKCIFVGWEGMTIVSEGYFFCAFLHFEVIKF